MSKMKEIALSLVEYPKGILAADESTSTMNRRLEGIGLSGSEQNRGMWRDLILSTNGINNYVSGVILYKETLENFYDSNKISDLLISSGIKVGIKVDEGVQELPLSNSEFFTKGIDGLKENLIHYKNLGSNFTKWRSVFSISSDTPSNKAIKFNATLLAIYASVVQEQEMIPIVEPEILMDGDHTIEQCFSATDRVLSELFDQINYYNVSVDSIILKPNMILPGQQNGTFVQNKKIAQNTLECLSKNLPNDIGGVAFLSGGQSDSSATNNLKEICQLSKSFDIKYNLTFSYGRAVLASALEIWKGEDKNILSAQEMIISRLESISEARKK